MNKDKRKDFSDVISLLFTIICLLSFITFGYFLFKVNIIPTKYLLLGYGVSVLIILVLLFTIFGKTKKITKIIALLFMTVLSFGYGFATYYLINTYDFLRKTQDENNTLTYSVLVLKNSNYSDINSLKGKTISYLSDDYQNDINKELSLKITYKESVISDFGNLTDLLLEGRVDSIVLEDSYLNLIYEEIESFEEDTEVIYSFTIKGKSHKGENTTDIVSEPFILYISGIDQYGKVNSVRGRSDVNQLIIVNPKTHHILLVNTPRDYYVQLAGTTGLKDKLTHAGIYGIDKSMSTLENLYDIEIDNYLRVNFNTLIKVVDVIGGIDVYSDKAFVPWTNRDVYVSKGWNHMNGELALAYARERYTYTTGDNHRGANQQQVITAIIEKISSSAVLISKYNSILDSLDGSFQTNMDMSLITSFIRYQLDKMPNWTIESTAVTGYNSSNYTYSMGTNYKLYVMEPNYESVNEAKKRIKEVLSEN